MVRLLLLALAIAGTAAAEAPPGRFAEEACRQCHGERDPELIAHLRKGAGALAELEARMDSLSKEL